MGFNGGRWRDIAAEPRRAGLALALLAAAVLLAALGFQHLGGYRPCPLCLYQRWPWWAAAALGLLAVLAAPRRRAAAAAFLALASLGLMAGASVAGYHAGVEWGFFPPPGTCAASGIDFEAGAGALEDAVMARPPVRCDAAAWRLLGVSMAGYNALLSLAGAAFAAVAALATRRRRSARA